MFIQIQVGMHTSKGWVGACWHHGVGLGDHQQWCKKCFPLLGDFTKSDVLCVRKGDEQNSHAGLCARGTAHRCWVGLQLKLYAPGLSPSAQDTVDGPPFLQGHLPPDVYTGSRNKGQAWTEEQFSLTLKTLPGHVSKLWDSFPSLAW